MTTKRKPVPIQQQTKLTNTGKFHTVKTGTDTITARFYREQKNYKDPNDALNDLSKINKRIQKIA